MNQDTIKTDQFLYLRRAARSWLASGYLNEKSHHALLTATSVSVETSSIFFRLLLMGFTSLAVGATAVFIFWVLDDSIIKEVLEHFCLLFAGLSYWGAEFLVQKKHHRRRGIEEGLTWAALTFLVIGLMAFADPFLNSKQQAVFGQIVVALGAAWIHRRFGWMHALVVMTAALTMIPSRLNWGPLLPRVYVGALFGGLLAVNLFREKRRPLEFQRAQDAFVQFFCLMGIYLAFHLRLDFWSWNNLINNRWGDVIRGVPAWFYYATFVFCWVAPLIVLWVGVSQRRRAWLRAGLITLIFTLISTKPYLNKVRHAWDPMVFGFFLMGVSSALLTFFARRGNLWRGWTSKNLLKRDETLASALSVGLGALGATPARGETAAPSSSSDGGGASGGAGAGRSF